MNMSASLKLDHLDTSVISIRRDASKLKQQENDSVFKPLWILRIQLLFEIKKGRNAIALLSHKLGDFNFQSDQPFQCLEEIAIDLDRMVKRLSEALEVYEDVPNKNFLFRVTKRQMEELFCQVEDVAETAALASKKEFHEVTAKIIDSHLKV
jgi:hypothetical protein